MYDFKRFEECVWFVAVAAATVLLQALASDDLTKIGDWHAYLVGLGAAGVRAGAGAALAFLTRPNQGRDGS